MESFTLEIDLGNEEMQDPDDIAEALREIATIVSRQESEEVSGVIYDRNGNRVGLWSLK